MNKWVSRVGLTALATISLSEVARRNNFPGRLWNDHGDVSWNRHQISQMETDDIRRYFKNRTHAPQADIVFHEQTPEFIKEFKSTTIKAVTDSTGRSYYLNIDEASQSRGLFFSHQKYQNPKNGDKEILVGVIIPREFFVEPVISLNSNNPHLMNSTGEKYVEAILAELTPLVENAASTRAEATRDAIESRKSVSMTR